jgi:Protein of unknown function (DUF3631)
MTNPALKLLSAPREPEAPPPDLAPLLDRLRAFVRRFVVLSDEQAAAVALWVAHTHAIGAADASPYLDITSPEPRCGKTLTLDVVELLVPRPWRVVLPSEAVLFRKLEHDGPTLLLDEVDAVFGPKTGANHEGLRALLNAGNRRGTVVPRCVGASFQLAEFRVFGAKALAGIGRLPATVADRSITIELRRRAPGETVERFRRRDVVEDASALRGLAAAWADAYLEQLHDARPALPEELDDRAADGWEPLLAIADLAGAGWAERARHAAVKLAKGAVMDDASAGLRLLADIGRVFEERGGSFISTADLRQTLAEDEEAPWRDWREKGTTISAEAIARLLRPYGIRSAQNWVAGVNHRGYSRSSFEDAWSRYTGFNPLDPLDPAWTEGLSPISNPLGEANPSGLETAANPNEQPRLAGLAGSNAETGKPGPSSPSPEPLVCGHDAGWLARDGEWRCETCEPPGLPGEVVEKRAVESLDAPIDFATKEAHP